MYHWWSHCQYIAIRRHIRHSCANRRYLLYSHTNIRRFCHSCAIRLSLCSYLQKCRYWLFLMAINLLLICIYNEKCPIYLYQGRFYVWYKQLYAQTKQLHVRFKQSLPSSQFGYDKLVKLSCKNIPINIFFLLTCDLFILFPLFTSLTSFHISQVLTRFSNLG